MTIPLNLDLLSVPGYCRTLLALGARLILSFPEGGKHSDIIFGIWLNMNMISHDTNTNELIDWFYFPKCWCLVSCLSQFINVCVAVHQVALLWRRWVQEKKVNLTNKQNKGIQPLVWLYITQSDDQSFLIVVIHTIKRCWRWSPKLLRGTSLCIYSMHFTFSLVLVGLEQHQCSVLCIFLFSIDPFDESIFYTMNFLFSQNKTVTK